MARIMLTDRDQAIRVQLWTHGAWRRNIRGQVIGSHDGIVGVLLDTGEYVDVPEERLRVVRQLDSNRWIPMEERLPECKEWMGVKGKEHYLRRMEIAVDSDTIEYFLVFYDGYKWFDKFGRTYAGIMAWRIHEPFNSQN